MATLWWIGATANGDVNVAGNWSYISPSGYSAGYTALVPSTNIPKYNDRIFFDKFIPAGVTYPLYSPSGTMRGICGPAGNTAAQYFTEVRVQRSYPRSLSGQSGFGFATSALIIRRGATSGTPSDYSNVNHIVLGDCAGVTKQNATISIDCEIKEGYWISGKAARLEISRSNGGAPYVQDRYPYGTYTLYDLELTGRTFTEAQISNPQFLASANAALVANETVLDYQNSLTNTSQVVIRVFPQTTITGNINLEGKEKLVVYRGFNLSSNTLQLANAYGQSSSGARVVFESDENSSLTGSQTDFSTRSYINDMIMVGWPNSTVEPRYPNVQMNHGVDINNLDFSGVGQISFGTEQDADTPRILRGKVRFGTANYETDDTNIEYRAGIYSDVDNISVGPAGQFIWDNRGLLSPHSYFRTNIRGIFAVKISPISED